jgi:hypothetical protein
VMAKLSSHRSQTHFVHRTEIRATQPPPGPAPVALLTQEDDPPPPLRYFDADGNRREITPEENATYDAWAARQSERYRRARLARQAGQQQAGQGTPSPNSSGSNRENGPRIRY